MEIRKILFPVDLADPAGAEAVAARVRAFAEAFGAEVLAVHVVAELADMSGLSVPAETLSGLEADAVAGAERKLAAFVADRLGGLPVATQVRLGDVAEELLAAVGDSGADLVIMGTHGRKGLDWVVFGSVAARLVRAAAVPVLTVNPGTGAG
ncbi:universal stress protein [Dissulfurirhabdus thermomarina]|uniref:Universal stress protein n=1 Tax=Dissulfurirhabdus thermomarina TaxID=1765737 RepID=A0A6N9TRK2_DISTH|nr:universal stress protein [Dissulfurirhabdus thermomarina]NDY42743.1 universal stress protein [Dissulfurirhabdus thermomarina]NMX22455.1 universal stress protein [Dissulfurirhabdus thermomarina]